MAWYKASIRPRTMQSRPIARYKRRVKERQEVQEYLRRRKLRREDFQAIKKKLRLDDPAVTRQIDRWAIIALLALLLLVPMFFF